MPAPTTIKKALLALGFLLLGLASTASAYDMPDDVRQAGGWTTQSASHYLEITNQEIAANQAEIEQNNWLDYRSLAARRDQLTKDQQFLTVVRDALNCADSSSACTTDQVKELDAQIRQYYSDLTTNTSQNQSIVTNGMGLSKILQQLQQKKNQLAGVTDPTLAAQIQNKQSTLASGATTAVDSKIQDANTSSKSKEVGQCWSLSSGFNWGNCLLTISTQIGSVATYLGGRVVWGANTVFNYSFDVSVRQFSNFANNEEVRNAWSIIRDLVNILLIFLLLWAAIGLILDLKNVEVKRLVASVIITALLVNFSFFLVNYLITGSNIMANQFYSLAANGKIDSTTNAPDIGGQFTSMSLLTNTGFGSQVSWGIVIAAFAQFLLTIIASVVLFAGALMMLARLIKLLLVLIFSPAALLLWAVPIKYAQGWGATWRDSFFKQAFFAPIYLFMLFVTLKVALVQGSAFSALHKPQANFNNLASADVASAIVYAVLINGLMIGSIVVAQKLSAYGADGAMGVLKGMGNRTRGWLGRNTAGWAAYRTNKWLDKKKGDMLQSAGGRLALGALRTFGSGAKSKIEEYANKKTFGGSQSYKGQREDTWKTNLDDALKAAGNDPEKLARLLQSYKNLSVGPLGVEPETYSKDKRNYIFGKLTPEQRFAIEKSFKSRGQEEFAKTLRTDWEDANKKKAVGEQREAIKLERQAKEADQFKDFEKKLNDYKEASADKKAEKEAEMLAAAKEIRPDRLKNDDIALEDIMMIAEKGGWRSSQLESLTKKSGGRLTPEQSSKLKTIKTNIDIKEKRQKRATDQLEKILKEDKTGGADVATILADLSRTTPGSANIPFSDQAIMNLDQNLMADIAAQKLLSPEQQIEVRNKFLAKISTLGKDATNTQKETKEWLLKDPIGQAFGKKN